MVSDHTDRHISIVVFSIFFSGKFAYMIAERFKRIHIKNRIHILNNRCQTLQPHSRINVFLLELAVISVSVIVKLGEHIIPDFHIPVAVTSHSTVRFAASVFFSPVVIYLRTRTART